MSDTSPAPQPIGEFALAVSLRGEGRHWAALLAPDGALCAAIASELVVELTPIVGDATMATVVITAGLLDELTALPARVVVAVEAHEASPPSWSALDRDRSRLPTSQRVVLVLTEGAFDRLQREAPNLASWLGGNVAATDLDADLLTGDEREEILPRLRAKFALTDEQVLALARRGEAPAEPEIAMWLVLLGHGELV